MKHNIDIVKEFSLNSPNPQLFRHNIIAADQLMTMLEDRATQMNDFANRFNQTYEHEFKTAEDYRAAYSHFNCFTFENWNALLDSENEMGESKLEEYQLEDLIGTRLFQLDCGYWVEFT